MSYFIKICRRTQRMDRAWMYDLARIDPIYIENVRHFVEEAMRHANRQKSPIYFVPVLIVKQNCVVRF
jgi:hypothetical protein